MIHDIDAALIALLRRDVLEGTDVEVVLDAPTKDWAARRNSPTLDLYLYDIREVTAFRQAGRVPDFDEHGRVASIREPVRRFRLSYLVTAWTQRPEDEHRLLGAVLGCLVRFDSLPADLVTGSLEGMPVDVNVGLPASQDRSISDVWSALGGELKPSLDLAVATPVPLGRATPAAPLVQEPAHVHISDADARQEKVGGAGGMRRSPAPESPARPGPTITRTRRRA